MENNEIPIIDLHCDFLSFLSHKAGRSIEDPTSRTSYAQLKQGHVRLQTVAIFSTTGPTSLEIGRKQIEHFLFLSAPQSPFFAPFHSSFLSSSPLVHLIPAFENASTFALEDEPLNHALIRLEEYLTILGPIFYISMTWNEENRFGGGNMTITGLKEDGQQFLEWMDHKNIAIDLSHTSDRLAYEILDFIDKRALQIPLIASHSNFRVISNHNRNLPEDLAKEIIRRQGLIGLNFFAPFIHPTDPSAIFRHIEYGLSLGGENSLCFGADFFCDVDCPDLMRKYQRTNAFYPEFSNASFYPNLLKQLNQKLNLKEDFLFKIAHQNAQQFLKKHTSIISESSQP